MRKKVEGRRNKGGDGVSRQSPSIRGELQPERGPLTTYRPPKYKQQWCYIHDAPHDSHRKERDASSQVADGQSAQPVRSQKG